MVYDLNIPWSPATPTDTLLQTLAMAASLGYSTVALNQTLALPLPAQLPAKAPFPSLPPPPPPSSSPPPPPPPPSSSSSKQQQQQHNLNLPTILHRATLPLSDPSTHNYRLASLATAYDLVAVRPLTEAAFLNACLTLDVPLISLDLSARFPFHFRPKPCMAAVSRGVHFELCYGQLLALSSSTRNSGGSGGDVDAARGRANFIANATSLIRATRGRGILISSEARTLLGLRAPADVVNLFAVWGLPADKGLGALRAVPRSVVVNEGLKRNGFRGVINIVQTAAAPQQQQQNEVTTTDTGPGTAAKSKPNQAGKAAAAANNQKRKSAQDGDNDAPMSKRQAKKMRVAARNSATDKAPG